MPSTKNETTMSSGKFITFDGIDGAGKSTHIAAVVDHCATLDAFKQAAPEAQADRE